jgi:hypothetical protein
MAALNKKEFRPSAVPDPVFSWLTNEQLDGLYCSRVSMISAARRGADCDHAVTRREHAMVSTDEPPSWAQGEKLTVAQ